jgi:ribonucleoside-diphosphate reductase alpha chain
VYRDGCRQGVLLTGKEEKKEEFEYKSSFKRPQRLECDIYHKVALKQDYMIIVGKVNGNPYEIFALRDVENHVFPTKIEKGYLTKVKSRTYELTSELQGKTFRIHNIVTLMTADQSTDTRKYSSMLRHGMHPQHIVAQIDEYASIVSFDKVIQRVLKNYIQEEHKKEKCPECGSENYHADSGCWSCPDCGYAKCG